jgi:transcriptional regulator with XRE-family HTH domain
MPSGKKIDTATIDRAKQLRAEGLKLRVISERLGISKAAISRLVTGGRP